MHKVLGLMLWLCSFSALAQQRVSNDLLSYEPPPATWKKEVQAHRFTSYGISTSGSYCQIFVTVGNTSKGDLTADFETEWSELIVRNYKVADPPTIIQTATEPGWQARAGVGTFEYGGTSVAMLTTISGNGRTASIIALTNTMDYAPIIQAVLASVKMNPVNAAPRPAAATPAPAGTKAQPTALQGYMEYNPFTKSWTWKLRYPTPR
jgi:hypothetical protein